MHRNNHLPRTGRARERTDITEITVRLADYSDSRALIRLAALDSARVPDGALVVAESDGQVVAALPMEGGRAIADPFHRTAALVEMLELRAGQLRNRELARNESLRGRVRSMARLQHAA